jgi:hypothetical protein
MLAIRLYVCALNLAFLFLVTVNQRVGALEAIVVTCALLYLILDVRADLKVLKADLDQLKQLEKYLSKLLQT